MIMEDNQVDCPGKPDHLAPRAPIEYNSILITLNQLGIIPNNSIPDAMILLASCLLPEEGHAALASSRTWRDIPSSVIPETANRPSPLDTFLEDMAMRGHPASHHEPSDSLIIIYVAIVRRYACDINRTTAVAVEQTSDSPLLFAPRFARGQGAPSSRPNPDRAALHNPVPAQQAGAQVQQFTQHPKLQAYHHPTQPPASPRSRRQKVWDKTKFKVVVVDEAHIARKMNGTFNHILRNLQCKSLLYVSGTPIMSTGRDLWDRCRVHCGDTGIDADLEIGRGQ
ncbi:hypothetical protein S40288_10860 [Stachybotrys chartarum IBT 40288]|nr:hypothetical protein S40288_10860 [Stachybotrys chartarum IBT 40288]